MTNLIHIDGSHGEGGGQIIRTSLSLSAITGKPVEISNVRARRSKPGLQPQHLAAVRAAASICAATVDGATVGSTRFRFEPQASVQAGSYRFEIGTAGAATLVAQTVAIPLALASGDSHVTIVGGTHVPHSPPAEFLIAAYLPALRTMGAGVEAVYTRAGFFPKGGGQIDLRIDGPRELLPFTLNERGMLTNLTAYIVTANLPEHVAKRGAATVEAFMKAVGRKASVEQREVKALDPGAAVIVVAECEGGIAGFSGLGERGKPMEKVATEPCEEFMRWWKSGAAVDEHLADQLILPAALTDGDCRWTTPIVTEHLRTVIWVVKQALSIDAHVEERENGSAVVIL